MKTGRKPLLITCFVIITLLLTTLASATPTTTVSITDVTLEPGSNITLPINIVNMEDYGTGTINLAYDPAVVHVTDVTGSSDSTVIAKNINSTIGFVRISAWNLDGVSGDIVFANVTFEAVAGTGISTPLNLTVDTLQNITYDEIPNVEINNGTVTISTVPILTVTLPEEGQVVKSSRIEWQSTGDLTDANHTILKLDNNANISYLPLSGNYTFQIDDGNHNVQAWLAYANNTPLANPESHVIVNFTLDTVTTVTIGPVISPTNVSSQTVTGTMENGATVEVTCPTATVGTVYPTDTTWSVEITGMLEGDNEITATTTDQAGNTASDTATIVLDITLPLIISVTLNDTVVRTGAPIEVNVSATDENEIVSVTANGTLLTLTGEYYVGTITAGTSPVTVIVTDEVGNMATDTSAIYIIDNELPEVSITEPLQNTTRFVDNIVRGQVSDNNLNSATLNVRDNTSTIVSSYDLSIIDNKFTQRVEYAPDQNNTLELIAIDEADNSNNIAKKVFVENNTKQEPMDSINKSEEVTIDAINETDTEIEFYSNVTRSDVTFTVTAITNQTQIDNLNSSAFAASSELAMGKVVEINVTGLDATNESEVQHVFVKLYYTKDDLDLDGDGTIEPGELDEDNLFIYWYNDTSKNWTKLLKDNPDWVLNNGQVKISGDNPGHVWVKVKHLSTFGLTALPEPEPSDDGGGDNVVRDNSGGSAGGGSGSSGEAYDNILLKESIRKYISVDTMITYQFEEDANSIEYITFDAKTTAGYVAATIEVLKDTSALVSSAPSGEVYQNMNILIGTSGYATENNIANPVIGFEVAKSWITENDIDESTIKLNRYSSDTWNPLPTTKTDEDDSYVYFSSETPGFSPFAITGDEKSSAAVATVQDSSSTADDDMKEPVAETADVPHDEDKSSGGFALVIGLIGISMLGVGIYLRKDEIGKWINQRR